MNLVKHSFADTFVFSRNRTAQYRDKAGALTTAAVDAPRFDHDVDGTPKGLLVEAGPENGQHDAIKSVAGWDAGVDKAMVLHEYQFPDGTIRRAAFYTRNVKATVDACLNCAVHHREIIAFDGWKRNRGGFVRFNGHNWFLGEAIAVRSGPLVSPVLADDQGRSLIEG